MRGTVLEDLSKIARKWAKNRSHFKKRVSVLLMRIYKVAMFCTKACACCKFTNQSLMKMFPRILPPKPSSQNCYYVEKVLFFSKHSTSKWLTQCGKVVPDFRLSSVTVACCSLISSTHSKSMNAGLVHGLIRLTMQYFTSFTCCSLLLKLVKWGGSALVHKRLMSGWSGYKTVKCSQSLNDGRVIRSKSPCGWVRLFCADDSSSCLVGGVLTFDMLSCQPQMENE